MKSGNDGMPSISTGGRGKNAVSISARVTRAQRIDDKRNDDAAESKAKSCSRAGGQ